MDSTVGARTELCIRLLEFSLVHFEDEDIGWLLILIFIVMPTGTTYTALG